VCVCVCVCVCVDSYFFKTCNVGDEETERAVAAVGGRAYDLKYSLICVAYSLFSFSLLMLQRLSFKICGHDSIFVSRDLPSENKARHFRIYLPHSFKVESFPNPFIPGRVVVFV
jgi:hypothetical protein